MYDFASSANWSLSWDASFATTPGTEPNTYQPIEEQIVPGTFTAPALAIVCESTTAKAHWRWAGYARQRYETGIVHPSIFDTNGAPDDRKLWLWRLNLMVWPPLTASYRLSLLVPYWLRDIQYKIWAYIGPTPGAAGDLTPALEQTEAEILAAIAGLDAEVELLTEGLIDGNFQLDGGDLDANSP